MRGGAPLDSIHIPLLAGVSDREAGQLRELAHLRGYARGQVLFHEGDQAEVLSVILDGHVRIWRCSSAGDETTLHILGRGDIPGCVAVFGQSAYPATATALTDVETLSWSAAALPEMVRAHPRIAANALSIVGARTEELLQRLQEVVSRPAEHRIARAILALLGEGGPDARLPVRRHDIAEMASTTFYTVSRLVSRWERDGLLRSGRGWIEVVDRGALERKLAADP